MDVLLDVCSELLYRWQSTWGKRGLLCFGSVADLSMGFTGLFYTPD